MFLGNRQLSLSGPAVQPSLTRYSVFVSRASASNKWRILTVGPLRCCCQSQSTIGRPGEGWRDLPLPPRGVHILFPPKRSLESDKMFRNNPSWCVIIFLSHVAHKTPRVAETAASTLTSGLEPHVRGFSASSDACVEMKALALWSTSWLLSCRLLQPLPPPPPLSMRICAQTRASDD